MMMTNGAADRNEPWPPAIPVLCLCTPVSRLCSLRIQIGLVYRIQMLLGLPLRRIAIEHDLLSGCCSLMMSISSLSLQWDNFGRLSGNVLDEQFYEHRRVGRPSLRWAGVHHKSPKLESNSAQQKLLVVNVDGSLASLEDCGYCQK